MREPISLLLVDDQKLLREGIRALLDREGDLTVAGEAGDGEEAVELYAALRPDVVLMDVQMPGVDGVKAIERIHEMDPEAKVVLLSVFDDEEYVIGGLRAGALGYLLKTMSGEELAAAVRTVHEGGAVFEPKVARKMVTAFGSQLSCGEAKPVVRSRGGEQEESRPAGGDGGREQVESGPVEGGEGGDDEANARLPEPLSRRELEVLGLIAEGLSNRRIANRLNLAEGTVKNYVSALMGKLNARDRAQAVLRARELDLV